MPKMNPSVNPNRTKRIFISDVHMSAGRSFNGGNGRHVYDWLGPEEANNFATFLEYLNKSGNVEEIILLGDIMNDWICPVDEIPPTFDEIIKAPINKEIVKHLKSLASHKEIKLVYIPGNHDMSVTKDFLEANFPGIIFGGSAANKSVYRTSRLLAEHGSAYTMFNAPDPINNPGSRLPLGYFISRVVATKAAMTGSDKRHYWTYIDDFLELVGPQKMPKSVFEAVLEEADLPDDVEIKMHPVGGKPHSIKANEVKEKYANLYDQWQTYYGPGLAFKAVVTEIGYLGDMADNISKKSDTNIIIFGHSHDCELDKDSWFVEDRIYANCGSWCDENKNKPCTFVETEKDREVNKHYVRLKTWDSKNKMVNEKETKEQWVEM